MSGVSAGCGSFIQVFLSPGPSGDIFNSLLFAAYSHINTLLHLNDIFNIYITEHYFRKAHTRRLRLRSGEKHLKGNLTSIALYLKKFGTTRCL